MSWLCIKITYFICKIKIHNKKTTKPMKRTVIFIVFIVTLVTIAFARGDSGSTISLTNKTGGEISISVPVLAEIIAYSDTISGEQFDIIASIYEETYACEGKLIILIPDDDYFDVIFIQEDEDGEFLEIQILTKDGWLEAEAEPYSRELIDLTSIVCMVQYILEISGP